MKIRKNIQIGGKHHKPILTDYFYTENNKAKPIVIFCHGYKGYKDWGAWNLMAKVFVEVDLFFVKFNFSHNGGTVENQIDFPDLEAFSNNNYTKETDDLETVIDFLLRDETIKNEIDPQKIILIGHSRGGGIVNLVASTNPKVTAVISWNGISDIASRFPTGEALAQWKKAGVGYVQNTRTKQQMPNKFQVYEDFITNKEKLDIKKAVENLSIPHLIIQGEKDEVVLPMEAENMHSWNAHSTLIIIKGMNHSLGNTQPWNELTMPNDLALVVRHTIGFLNN